MDVWPKVFIMSSNIWKQFSSTVTSDYYRTKYHNILNELFIFFFAPDVGSCTEGGADQTRQPGADYIQFHFVAEACIYFLTFTILLSQT